MTSLKPPTSTTWSWSNLHTPSCLSLCFHSFIFFPCLCRTQRRYCAGGELFEHIVSHEHLSEKETKKYFRQVVDAVDFLHSCNIVHRDLKPENLLLDKHRNIKLIDFGMAAYFKEDQTFSQTCGSLAYASPEMLAGTPYSGVAVDIWSLGVILYACLTGISSHAHTLRPFPPPHDNYWCGDCCGCRLPGYLPFEDPDHAKLQRKIQIGKFSVPYNLSHSVRELIKRILGIALLPSATPPMI